MSHHQINVWLNELQYDLLIEEKTDQLQKIREFLTISDALTHASIWFIPLKGPLLSYRIHGDATCRRFKDLDFLIHPAYVRQTVELLKQIGYVPKFSGWPLPGGLEERFISVNNQFSLICSQNGLQVEIHWKLINYKILPVKRIENLITENSQAITFAGRTFTILSLEFELLYLIMHGGFHAWTRLKWLADIRDIVKSWPVDWNKFEKLVKQLRAERMVGLTNRMLAKFYPGTVLPFQYVFPEKLFTYASSKLLDNKDAPDNSPSGFFALTRYRLMAFPGLRYKIGVARTIPYWIQGLNLPFTNFLVRIYRSARKIVNLSSHSKKFAQN